MSKMLFVNLPVDDLARARSFYEAIGATNNPQFTDETAACMVFSDTIFVMLLTRAKWGTFTSKPIVDAHQSSEVMLALSCDSRVQVDAVIRATAHAGGRPDVNPPQDLGFMYSRSFEDPDGHIWELMWMDPSVPQ